MGFRFCVLNSYGPAEYLGPKLRAGMWVLSETGTPPKYNLEADPIHEDPS